MQIPVEMDNGQLRSLIAVTGEGDERAMVRALSAIVTEYQPERLELVGTNGNAHKRNGNGNGNGNGHRARHTNGNGATRRRLRRATSLTDTDLTAPAPTPQTLVADPLLPDSPDAPPGGAVAGGGTAT